MTRTLKLFLASLALFFGAMRDFTYRSRSVSRSPRPMPHVKRVVARLELVDEEIAFPWICWNRQVGSPRGDQALGPYISAQCSTGTTHPFQRNVLQSGTARLSLTQQRMLLCTGGHGTEA
jgi:hypothetical protein